jgi:hypothetical protein
MQQVCSMMFNKTADLIPGDIRDAEPQYFRMMFHDFWKIKRLY